MPRVVVVGDVHGCHQELLDLCDRAAVSEGDVLVSVGDLVDRGPDPAACVRFFRERAGAVVLMGNHERKHVRGVLSYGQEITRLQMGNEYAGFLSWARALPYFFEGPGLRVVHAAVLPGVPLGEQREDVLAGTTAGEAFVAAALGGASWTSLYDEPVPLAFGHRVFEEGPFVREGSLYGLDTGACHGHSLTALSFPDMKLWSVPARADHFTAVKRAWQAEVLRARPLGTVPWDALVEELDRRGRSPDPEVARAVAEARTWADEVRALVDRAVLRVPEVLADLRALHGEGLPAALREHPARALLFACLAGRFDRRAIDLRCGTPEATLRLAGTLGLPTAHLEAGPWA